VRVFFIIMIGLMVGGPMTVMAADCVPGEGLIVTAPRDGARTMNPSITIRGYVCDNYPLITIRNRTTSLEVITETREICEGSECTYHFAAPVRELALGENRITAEVPGSDAVEIEVVRTALASTTSVSESRAAGSGLAGM
jgi:hypothetical protein